MNSDIKIRHINNLSEFESLRGAWENLLSQRKIKTAFLTWEWLFAWWKTQHGDKELWLITAWKKDELVGIAPLMLSNEKKYGLHFRLLQSLGVPNTDESDFLTVGDNALVLESLCKYILEHKSEWDALRLHELRSSLPSTMIIKDFFTKGQLISDVQNNYHFYIPISGTWDTYFKSLSRNMRQSTERRLRRTKETSELTFQHYKGQEVNWSHFESIFEISRNGNYPEKYQSESERSLHREVLERFNQKGWIEIAFISLNGTPAAFEYGFNLNGRFEEWRTGYNKNFGKQGVGRFLIYFLLQEFFNRGYIEFDFLRGEYGHKKHWQPLKNEFITVTATPPLSLSAQVALIAIPTLWKWVKKHINIKRTNTPVSEQETDSTS